MLRQVQSFGQRAQQMLERACAGQMQDDLVFALPDLDGDLEELGDDGRWLRLRQRSMLQSLGTQLLMQNIGGGMQ